MNKENSEIQDTLIKGVQAHQASRLEEASAAYLLILKDAPDHADANHLLGLIAHQSGNHDKAIQLIKKAIKANGTASPFHNNLGNAHKAIGNLQSAADSYRMALTIKPDDSGTLSNLGLALAELGSSEEAIDCYKSALQIDPNILDTNMRLAILLDEQDSTEEAIKYFKQAATIMPDDDEIHTLLSSALYKKELFHDAAASLQMAISINPNKAENYSNLSAIQLGIENFEEAAKSCYMALEIDRSNVLAHNNLGVSLTKIGQNEEAEASFRKALELNPKYAEALSNLGKLLHAKNPEKDIMDYFHKAIKINPRIAEFHSNLGSALGDQDNLKEAEETLRHALELDPEHRQAKINLSMNLLRSGHLKEGWDLYDSRLSRDRKTAFSSKPFWDGSALAYPGKNEPIEKSIILWGDQGLGDEVRFASIIPDLQRTGAKITIECDKRLTDIFARSFPEATILAYEHGGAANNPKEFDYQCPLTGLARFFRNDYESFANDGNGHLKADPALTTFWKKRLKDIGPQPKIGISWNSPVKVTGRVNHYASIEELSPILNTSGIDFVNLQSHESNEDLAKARKQFGVEIHTWNDLDYKNDLNGIAALTSNLDLVISFPTFSAELAGSLGVPTLCFVSHKNSFEELGSNDNIWYHNTHHISKNINDPWQPVFEKIAEIVRLKFDL
jgi:tetratricopeptide (TPR) repeat protein